MYVDADSMRGYYSAMRGGSQHKRRRTEMSIPATVIITTGPHGWNVLASDIHSNQLFSAITNGLDVRIPGEFDWYETKVVVSFEKIEAELDPRHCCGTCVFYNPGQVDSENFGRCEFEHHFPFWANAQSIYVVHYSDVNGKVANIGLTPEDGEGCKAWRVKGCQ